MEYTAVELLEVGVILYLLDTKFFYRFRFQTFFFHFRLLSMFFIFHYIIIKY